MRIASLHVYPLKSTAPLDVDEARVEPWGLAGDRRWMLVDTTGAQVTARIHPRLLHVVARPRTDGSLDLSAPGSPSLTIPRPAAEPVPVRVWRSALVATPAGPEADAWCSGVLGLPVRLVWLDDPTRRPTNPAHSEPGDRVSFADGYPLLAANTASLRQLDAWVAARAVEVHEPSPAPLSMRRFRPNVVVDTDEPFAEDDWKHVRIGEVPFRVAKPCDRCVLTTVDPVTLARGKEPLRTLARHRRGEDGTVLFGVQLIPDASGTVRVGDPVAAT